MLFGALTRFGRTSADDTKSADSATVALEEAPPAPPVEELISREPLEPVFDEDKAMLQWERAAISRSMAMIEFEPDGTIQTANDNFLGATGYSLEEIQGQHHRIFCTKEYVDSPAYAALWRRLNQGEFFTSRVHRICKDGSDLWIEATYNPIINDHGQVVKVMKLALDVTASVERDAEASQTAFGASQRSDAASTNGQERVDDAVQAIRQSTEAIANAQESVKELGEKSQEISKVVSSISSIAMQVNLLAINAAIEAKRAGRHGAGFGVVAEEVRKLANRAKSSAESIGKVVEENNQQSNAVISHMNDAVAHSENGLNLAEEAGQLIQETSKNAADVVAMVRRLTEK